MPMPMLHSLFRVGTFALPISRLLRLISRYGLLSILLLTLPVASALADNETVAYPDDALNPISISSMGFSNALAPTDASNNNRVTVDDTFSATSPDFVFGGYNTSGGSTGNTVTLNSGATVNYSVFGGFATNGGSATGNTVILNSGATAMAVYGGWAEDAGSASGNTVILKPGATALDVYGGFLSSSAGATADNNTVIFHSGAIVNGNVYGGSRFGSLPIGVGNTLELRGAGQNIGGDLGGFQNLNFYLPSTLAANDTMLSVGGTATITGATVNVGIEGGSSPLKAGDTVTLIDAATLTGTPANTTANGQGMQGVTLKYTFDILTDNNKLLATVSSTGPTVNPQTKALSEGFLGGMGLVTQGADVAAGQGMDAAVSAAKSGAAGGYGLAGFGALSGGSVRYNTGSHVDMHSLSLLAGLAWGVDMAPGRLTLGAFFEYGNGSYNTYNSFSNAASVDGNGNTHYLGGGILGRYDFINTGPGRFYAEASGRAGNVYNNYESSDLRDAKGREASYDSTSAYYGLHLGTGYIWNITDKASLDLYGKYFWTRQAGDSITLSTGDPIDFDDVYSSRLRFGSRFAYAVNEYVSPYVGAAWEHEFDGKARASTNGYDIKAPSLRGDTGIGELGLTFTPSQTLPLSFDLGVQGYAGKREGVTGSLQAKWEF